KDPGAAIAIGKQRDRAPGRRSGTAGVEHASDRTAEVDAHAVRGIRSQGPVVIGAAIVGEVLGPHARIRGEPSGGEDDSACGLERASALRSLGDDGGDSSRAVLDEVVDAVSDADVDAEVDRRLHETAGEGDTVDEVHALTGRGEV